jgi:hypothetical protein
MWPEGVGENRVLGRPSDWRSTGWELGDKVQFYSCCELTSQEACGLFLSVPSVSWRWFVSISVINFFPFLIK